MIKKIGIPLIVFTLLLPVSPGFIAFPQNQNPNYTLTIPDYPVWAAIGDVDNDALNDIVITTSEVTSATGENDGVKVFYQLADGSFHASPDTNITQRLPYQVLIADADHDGDNDIITNNMDLQTISIFYRNHDGLSTTQDVELKTGEGTGDYAWSIATGHFNNDNYLDLVVGCGQWIKPNTWIDSLKIFYGPFTDNQAPGTTITLGNNIGPSSLVIGYLNQDTKDDIAMTCYDKNQLYIFYQTLEGTFSTTPDTILTTSAVPNAVDIGYLNDDLKIDIATCLDNGKIDVYYQSSGFPQNPSATLDTQTTKAHDICIANVDDKYRDDIIVTSLLGTKIFYQTSGGTLPNTPDYTLTNSYDDYLTVGLLNTKTDMMNDIVTLNVGTDTAAVFYQDPPAVGIAVREIKIKESTNPYLLINETVQVKTTISNDGITDATNLHVRLYIDSLQQASYTISSLAHGASTTISPKNFTWKCSVLGEHYVNVTVDVKPGESNTDNNKLEFKPKPLVRAPDLAPLAVTVEGNIGGGATLSATIINYGDGDASYPGGIQVRFYSADPGTNPDHPSLITTSKIQGTLLADNRRTTVTGQWNNPQADTTIWVWVDPLKHVDESSEGNNKNFISIGSAPVVTQIRPWYLNYEVDVENIFVFSNKDILITYKATVENYAPIIKTSFTLTGPGTDDSYDDVDGSDGWSWALNLNGKDQGTYTLTAQANNSLGVTSNIKTYHIYVIDKTFALF